MADALPTEFALESNFPNPFNPSTTIRFVLPVASPVILQVYSVTGQKVATLLSGEHREAGRYTVEFNAADLASGLYFYRIEAGDFTQVRKMTLIR